MIWSLEQPKKVFIPVFPSCAWRYRELCATNHNVLFKCIAHEYFETSWHLKKNKGFSDESRLPWWSFEVLRLNRSESVVYIEREKPRQNCPWNWVWKDGSSGPRISLRGFEGNYPNKWEPENPTPRFLGAVILKNRSTRSRQEFLKHPPLPPSTILNFFINCKCRS